nr:sensor histidine kinase [Plastoroseomonas arctica]
MKRAFANLIDNAVNCGAGARVVLEDKGQHILVRIEDDGPGIPEGAMQFVFEPFRRLETSRNHGTGQRAWPHHCRRAVEQHGGILRLITMPAGGLGVCILLPKARDAIGSQ